MLCLALLLCGFTSNKGGISGVETVNFIYTTDKPPKDGEVLLTMYESKSNTKYNGFVTSDGTSSQIKIKVSAELIGHMTIGSEWYNCHALVNITPECKEKLEKGLLRIAFDPKGCQSKKSEKK